MISVIMSIYNESASDLSAAVDSILNQTYQDFEFLIVCDNPDNEALIRLIQGYAQKDQRVRLIQNEQNIGLAMSLNKAAAEATGEYLFRMDADDIACPTRMMEQYEEMIRNDLDLVSSGYDVIDENSRIIRRDIGFHQDETMRSSIPYQVTIHHPTVMMKKSFFDAVGGYRNYICAQDYDLWLRMWYANGRMKNLNKALLQYRVRENSITSKKRFLQKLTTDYIKELFWQRLKTGADSYSYEGYLAYVKKHGAYDPVKNKKFLKGFALLSQGNALIRAGSRGRGYWMRGKAFFVSKAYRQSYVGRFKTKRLVKAFLKKAAKP